MIRNPRLRQALVWVATFAVIVAVELLVLAYVRRSGPQGPAGDLPGTIVTAVGTFLIAPAYLVLRRLTRIAALPAVAVVMAAYVVFVVVVVSRLEV